jgi:hypothetical protein
LPDAAAAPRRRRRARVRRAAAIALALAALAALAACSDVDTDTPAEVSRYCERYRAYVRADARSVQETDRDEVAAAVEAAVGAREAMERATPPSLRDEADTIESYQLMTGEDRSVTENRLDHELALDRIDAFRTEHCTLG